MILFICLFLIFILNLIPKNNNKLAKVYHDNKLVLEIDLTKKEKNEYFVKGDKGTIKIVTKYGKIKVEQENSKYHLCSKQGYIENTYETIICLPNKVVIKIESNELDAIVGD